MTELESRLRNLLEDVDPGPVDAEVLAAGARRYAARARRRVALGVVSAAVVAAVAVGGVIGLTSRERAALPATPTPGQSTVPPSDLCSRAGDDLPVKPGPLSEDYTAVALCPEDPAAPEWRRASTPMFVTGRAVDLVELDRDDPSAAPCVHTQPFPEMRFVLQARTGQVMAVHGSRLRCGGRFAVQSLNAAVAESRLPYPDTVQQPCWPAYPPFPAPGLRVGTPAGEATSLSVCAHPSPVEGEVDAVPHEELVMGFTPTPDEQATMLEGLLFLRPERGSRDSCPWAGLRVVVRLEASDGAVSEQHLHCDPLPEAGGRRVSWLELPAEAQAVLEPFLHDVRGLSDALDEP